MRIGFDGTPLLGQRSGVGYYTGNLLSALMEVQPDWEYLLYSNRPLNGLEPPLPRAQNGHHRYFPRSRWLWMQTILPSVIRDSQPNLCHFTNALAPLWQPAPYVLTIHDASLFVYGEYHPWLKSKKAVIGFCGGHVTEESLTSGVAGATVRSKDRLTDNIFEKREVDAEGVRLAGAHRHCGGQRRHCDDLRRPGAGCTGWCGAPADAHGRGRSSGHVADTAPPPPSDR